MSRASAAFSYACPACGQRLNSTSLRALNSHERSARHCESVAERGFPVSAQEYDRAASVAWATYLTTPSARKP
jgi:hypothetical protein